MCPGDVDHDLSVLGDCFASKRMSLVFLLDVLNVSVDRFTLSTPSKFDNRSFNLYWSLAINSENAGEQQRSIQFHGIKKYMILHSLGGYTNHLRYVEDHQLFAFLYYFC